MAFSRSSAMPGECARNWAASIGSGFNGWRASFCGEVRDDFRPDFGLLMGTRDLVSRWEVLV